MPGRQSIHAVTRAPTAAREYPRVYLSFDDGPDDEWTPRVLDVLASAQVLATFFVVGQNARKNAACVRRALDEGHEIGNHSWSHRHPWTMSPKSARSEVRNGAAAIADITGRASKVFRPPHGRLRRCMLEEAAASDQITVLWSVSAIDWGPFGRAEVIAKRLAHVDNGDIVLMHDGKSAHNKPHELVRVLPAFLQLLATRRLQTGLLSSF
jgi:peptidoglycan/xylan/chitin deacetylase (PgdA/CDA1 family)